MALASHEIAGRGARRLSVLLVSACLLRCGNIGFSVPSVRPPRGRAFRRAAAQDPSVSGSDAKDHSLAGKWAAVAPVEALRDYTPEATSLLEGVRTPAAFIAGAAFGGSFGLPLCLDDGFTVGLAKRAYVVAGCAAFCAELSAVVAATIAVNKLSRTTSGAGRLHRSPSALLHSELELEWVSAQFNFLTGLVLFSATVATRAWLSIKCPTFAKAVACMIVSASAFMCSLINDEIEDGGNAFSLGRQYARLVVRRIVMGPCLLKVCSLAFLGSALYYFVVAALQVPRYLTPA